ncbi:MAG: hypothetical protein U0263_35570 [Polyangiaceae bacterium]
MQALRRATGFVLALSILTLSERVDAACNRPDLIFSVPPPGATGVPPNAKLFARYRLNAEYDGEDVTLESSAGSSESLTADWNSAETLLSVAPALESGGTYTVTWPRLRGINSANLGKGGTAEFSVGSAPDADPPAFAGLTGLSWDVDRERDDCTDSLEDRYVFDFDLADASDDGGRESLMVVVFQTRGPHVKSSAPEPISVQRMPEGNRVRVTRTLDDGEGDVCFAAVTRDLTGKVSASGAEEVCTTTVAPPFFNGCALASAPTESRGAAAWVAALGAALLFFRRGGR